MIDPKNDHWFRFWYRVTRVLDAAGFNGLGNATMRLASRRLYKYGGGSP